MISKQEKKPRKSMLNLLSDGFLIVLPLLLIGVLLEKLFAVFESIVGPLSDVMPGVFFHNPVVRSFALFAVMVLFVFLIGLLARTQRARSSGRWLEARLLNHMPFYLALRNLSSGLAGRESEPSLKPVLVTVNPGIQQMGFLIERHADGGGTIFFPSAPNPSSGSVMVVEAALIRELHVPGHSLLKSYNRWGSGMAKMVKTAGEVVVKTR